MIPIFYDIQKEKAFTSKTLKGTQVHVNSVVYIGRNVYRIVRISRVQSISDTVNTASMLLDGWNGVPSEFLILYVMDITTKNNLS